MAKRKRLKLKEPFISIGRIGGIILAIILAVFLFYRYEIHTIKRLGYSEKASQFILFNFKKSYVKQLFMIAFNCKNIYKILHNMLYYA